MGEFLALELWLNRAEDFGNVARRIKEEGVYQIDEYGEAKLVNDDANKDKALQIVKDFRVEAIRDEHDDIEDYVIDYYREQWSVRHAGKYGLLDQPAGEWRPNSRHVGYQLVQVLLIKSGLVSAEQMKNLKHNPGMHLPSDLCDKLNLLGVEADQRAIRRHVIEAARTFYG